MVPAPRVVRESESFVIVDKPALLDSQNSKAGRFSLVDWLNERFGFAGLVHRLDFGTSGLLVCAKNAEAANDLTKDLQAGRISREYVAVVMGTGLPHTGKLSTPIETQSATTHFRVIETFANATLVSIELETGRKHQIRRHFADAGHPLLGDHLYGKGGSKLLFDRPALHAYRITVKGAPTEIELPEDLQKLLTRLRSRRS